MKCCQFLPAAMLLLTVVRADRDPSVCLERPPNGGPQIPSLPNVFEAYVECNMVDSGYTAAVMEYYDGVNNRGVIHSEAHGTTRSVIYDFPRDRAFVTVGDRCQTQKASELSMSNLGLFGVNLGNRTGHIYSVNQVFHFGPQYNLFYEGLTDVRGIPVNWWSTCQYMAELDVTFFGEYYFTIPGYQSAGYKADDLRNPIPVRINVTGKTGGDRPKHINHVYEFSQFRTIIDAGEEVFETPPHIYCSGRENTVPLPTLPEVFSFRSEVVMTGYNVIGNFKEWYDTTDQMVRLDAKLPSSNPISQVDDFTTGLSYTIDKVTDDCTVAAIRNISAGGDDLPVDLYHVRMLTVEEFFRFAGANWSYIGEVDVGGLPCMKWITLRDDFPVTNPIQSTWEWYFSKPGWTSAVAPSGSTSENFPVQLEIRGVHQKDFGVSYSFFMFNELVDIADFDIVSQCYSTAQKKRVQIIFPGQFPPDLNLKWFKTALKKEIASEAQVHSLRVTDIQIDCYSNQIVVEATLLDTPQVAGDVVKPVTEVNMADAYKNLHSAVQGNQLRFLVPVGVVDFNRVPVAASFVREVGIHSTAEQQVTYTKGNVRLVGGRTEGQLQLAREADAWGGVCSSGWDIANARVACQQLGYDDASQATYCVNEPVSPRAAQTTPESWLYDVRCTGTEDSILSCPNGGWRSSPCDVAGVICIDTIVPPTTTSPAPVTHSSSPAQSTRGTPPSSTPDKCAPAPSTPVRYSTGVLAGTAVAMLVLGGLIGNGVGFVVRKRLPQYM